MSERICKRAVLTLVERADATINVFISRRDEEVTEDNIHDWVSQYCSRCSASTQRFPARGTTM